MSVDWLDSGLSGGTQAAQVVGITAGVTAAAIAGAAAAGVTTAGAKAAGIFIGREAVDFVADEALSYATGGAVPGLPTSATDLVEGAVKGVGKAAAKRSTDLGAAAIDHAPKGGALIPIGKYLNTIDDVLANPQLLAGKTPAQIQAIIGKTPGWSIETLGKGAHQGQGWVLREINAVGNPTGRMLRWHPGGGHHGPNPYWRVNSHQIKSGIIPGGAM